MVSFSSSLPTILHFADPDSAVARASATSTTHQSGGVVSQPARTNGAGGAGSGGILDGQLFGMAGIGDRGDVEGGASPRQSSLSFDYENGPGNADLIDDMDRPRPRKKHRKTNKSGRNGQ